MEESSNPIGTKRRYVTVPRVEEPKRTKYGVVDVSVVLFSFHWFDMHDSNLLIFLLDVASAQRCYSSVNGFEVV